MPPEHTREGEGGSAEGRRRGASFGMRRRERMDTEEEEEEERAGWSRRSGGASEPASTEVRQARRGCDPDRNGTDAPDLTGVGPHLLPRPAKQSGPPSTLRRGIRDPPSAERRIPIGRSGFGVGERLWSGAVPGDGGRQRGVGPRRWRLAATTGLLPCSETFSVWMDWDGKSRPILFLCTRLGWVTRSPIILKQQPLPLASPAIMNMNPFNVHGPWMGLELMSK